MNISGFLHGQPQKGFLYRALLYIKASLKITCILACIVSGIFLLPAVGNCTDDAFSMDEGGEKGTLTITGLSQKDSVESTTIRITADGSLNDYKTYDLFYPPRLVVDLMGTQFPGENLYKSTSDLIKNVSVERDQPGTTRFVFYMAGITGVLYTIAQDGGTMTIDFCMDDQEDTPPVPKIVSPAADTVIHAGKPQAFSGSVTGGNRPFLSQWIFSGNQMRYTRYEQGPFTFESSGTYEVTFMVTDRDGETASDSIAVSVVDNPSAASKNRPGKQETTPGFGSRSEGDNHSIWPEDFLGISLNAGSYISSNCEDFVLIADGDLGQEILTLTGRNSTVLAANPSFKVASFLRLDLYVGQFFINKDTDLFYLSAGPRFFFPTKQNVKPYVRCAAVYGRLDCTNMPGRFRNSYGWEYGYGVIASRWNLEFGAEMFYRDISFDYEEPLTQTVEANHDYIDFSGYAVCASIAYRF